MNIRRTYERRTILALLAFIFLSFVASTSASLFRTVPVWNNTWTDRLRRDLLYRYDKFARPAQHFNVTVVNISMEINEVTVDEFKSSMIVQAWVRMTWTDEKLKWNATKYGGLNELIVENHEIWQPHILLYNSVSGTSIEPYGDAHCTVTPCGTVYWTPPTQFNAFCELDLRLWPFDTQHCYLKLVSWLHSRDHIDLRFRDDNYFEKTTIQYTQWALTEVSKNRTSAKYAFARNSEYMGLFYNLTLRRYSPMYYATIITPATTIVFLILVIFWLPPQSTDKIILSGCTTLIISMFLIYLSLKVPPLAGKPPLLICFYSGCLSLVTISLVISAFVINLSRRPHCRPLPRGIKKLLVGRTGQYLALFDNIQLIVSLGPRGEQELRENRNVDANAYYQSNSLSSNGSEIGDGENIIAPSTRLAQLEWILAATAIDRLTFVVFSVIFAIMAMICLT